MNASKSSSFSSPVRLLKVTLAFEAQKLKLRTAGNGQIAATGSCGSCICRIDLQAEIGTCSCQNGVVACKITDRRTCRQLDPAHPEIRRELPRSTV